MQSSSCTTCPKPSILSPAGSWLIQRRQVTPLPPRALARDAVTNVFLLGFDPTFNLSNRWWYWRGGRSAFGRFETDSDGLFFMRGNPSSTGLQQGSKRKRPRLLKDTCLGDTDVLADSE